jgi:hypothetical protein
MQGGKGRKKKRTKKKPPFPVSIARAVQCMHADNQSTVIYCTVGDRWGIREREKGKKR